MAETERAEAESDRIQAESDRASAETARTEAEEDRAGAETLRISAEQERATAQAKNNADQQANNASAQGLVAVILTSGEYDPDTLEPTVEGAVGKMYLVPMPQAQAVAAAIPVRFSLQSQDDGTYVATQAAAADGDTYVEWLWIAGAWERIGLSTATIDPITTDQIDSVCSDGAPQGKQVLNLTGLSYLWAKVKAWATGAFAALSHTHPASQVTGLTASRALVSDSSGHPAASAVTATELGYLDGVTSGVQGQIDALGDSLSRTFRSTILLNQVTQLAPGESVIVPGLSSHAWTLVMGYCGNYGERTSTLIPGRGASANVALPSRAGTQIVRQAGDAITAPTDNTSSIWVNAVLGIDIGA